MATHSSFLTWRIPWTEEPGRLQSRFRKESDMTERLTLSLSHCSQRNTKETRCRDLFSSLIRESVEYNKQLEKESQKWTI